MTSIRVLSTDLKMLGEIDDYESLSFTKEYHGIGDFELRINSHKLHVDKLQKRNLIMLDNDPNKVGFIQYREIGMNESGKQSEQWVITGSTLNAVATQRITIPPVGMVNDVAKGNAETVMKQYVNNSLVNPTDPNRKLDILTIANDKQLGDNLTYNSRFKVLSDELTKISELSDVGWNIALDEINNKWVFDCYVGTNRTINQDINPPIVFSTDFETLKEAQFMDSDIGYKNYAYVAGQGEGAERAVVEVGNDTGLDRFELFTDARDIENEADLPARGESNLQGFTGEVSFEATIMPNSIYTYEKDWFLGDVVSVIHSGWGVSMHPRITAVTEIYEPSGYRVEAVFGKAVPTLITKIKQELLQISAEVRK